MLQLPELEFPSFDSLAFPDLASVQLDPAAFARFTLSNPPAAVAASVAAYVVIPRAAKVLTKYVLIPAVVVAVLAAVAEDPAGAAAAASAAAREAAAHPTETSAVILALAFLALSPYILLAALLALILSGAQLLPERLAGSSLVPTPVRLANERVASAQRAAEPAALVGEDAREAVLAPERPRAGEVVNHAAERQLLPELVARVPRPAHERHGLGARRVDQEPRALEGVAHRVGVLLDAHAQRACRS